MWDERSCCGEVKIKDCDVGEGGGKRGGCWTSTGDVGSTFMEIRMCSWGGGLEDNKSFIFGDFVVSIQQYYSLDIKTKQNNNKQQQQRS